MQKYRLLKDLPLAKAGTVVAINADINLYIVNEDKDKILAFIDKEKISEWLEEIPEKPKSIFDLKIGDEYYSITSGGMCVNIETNHIEDTYGLEKYKNRLLHNNAFSTEEEARKELNKRKAIQKIKKYCWENGIDTTYKNKGIDNNVFYLDRAGETLFIQELKNGNPLGYFSQEDGQRILEKFEEELKIILE